MNITKKQATRILLALSVAGFLGGVDQVFAAEDLPTSPVYKNETVTYSGTGDKIISSQNVEELPANNSSSAIIRAGEAYKNPGSITVSGYDSLTVHNQTNGNTGYANALFAGSGSAITVQNVGTVDITNDTPNGYNGATVALHAYGGTIDIKNVDNLNVTANNSTAIMAQQTGNTEAGKIHIDVNKDIHITGGSVSAAVYANAKDPTKNEAELTIHSGGTTVIDGGVNVQNKWYGGNDAMNGTAKVSIQGDAGVHITGNVQGSILKPKDAGEGDFGITIESAKGDVNLDKGIYLDAADKSTAVGASVKGNNITIGKFVASTGDKGALHVSNATLDIGGNSATTNVNLNGSVNIKESGTVNIKNASTVYVDGNELTNGTFLSVENGSQFNLDNGSAIILKNWKDENKFATEGTKTDAYKDKVFVDNVFKSLDLATGKVEATTDTATLDKALEGVVAKNVIKEIATNDKYADLAKVLITDTGANKVTSNAAVNLGELAGLNHSTYTVSNLFTDTVGNHLSTLPQDKDLWGYYVHSKESVDGLGLAGIAAKYDTTYDGAVVGMDLYKNGNTAGGVAVSYINGSLEGAGIKNDADYYGLSVYGRKDLPSFSLVGDVSYLHGSNDITQTVAGKTVTAKPDVDAFTVGVKALKDIALTESSKLTPYVGARYLRINTESYSSSLGLHYDADSQDLLLIPVGVDYSADFKHGAWTYRPTVGVGYVWNAAGRSVDETVSWDNAADFFSYNTVDSSSFIAHVGVAAEKENLSFGVGYEYQNGSSTSADKWYVNAAYRF